METKSKEQVDELLHVKTEEMDKLSKTREDKEKEGKPLGKTIELDRMVDESERALNPELERDDQDQDQGHIPSPYPEDR